MPHRLPRGTEAGAAQHALLVKIQRSVDLYLQRMHLARRPAIGLSDKTSRVRLVVRHAEALPPKPIPHGFDENRGTGCAVVVAQNEINAGATIGLAGMSV